MKKKYSEIIILDNDTSKTESISLRNYQKYCCNCYITIINGTSKVLHVVCNKVINGSQRAKMKKSIPDMSLP